MRLALEEAGAAEAEGEVPVGAVVVYKDEVVGRGCNRGGVLCSCATGHCKNNGDGKRGPPRTKPYQDSVEYLSCVHDDIARNATSRAPST